MIDSYESPFSSRYASDFMKQLFSYKYRSEVWRKLWVSLAKAEHKLGLPVSEEQIAQLEDHVYDIDFETVAKREKEVRHDVMAHVYAFGKVAPKAAGIIHLGATSCYVTDNSDLIIYKKGLRYILNELRCVLKNLGEFADKYKKTATLGYTHYQPAQLVTIGKRATLWMQDFYSDIIDIENYIKEMKFLGCRGTTGTEASFLKLFDGDEEKIKQMNKMISFDFGFDQLYSVCGQTYPRKTDSKIMNLLSLVGQSAYKFANDIRLLQHDRQIEEPFEINQIGSSAMAYKRNPMRCERVCSLARYLISDAINPAITASCQWLERTLDDSAIRRISIPEAFLCTDSILRLVQNVTAGLKVNKKIIQKDVDQYLPFMATENVMMEAVQKGGDRQIIHEHIRKCSMESIKEMNEGLPCSLLEKLSKDKAIGLSIEELNNSIDQNEFIGRCSKQVDDFLNETKQEISLAKESAQEVTL